MPYIILDILSTIMHADFNFIPYLQYGKHSKASSLIVCDTSKLKYCLIQPRRLPRSFPAFGEDLAFWRGPAPTSKVEMYRLGCSKVKKHETAMHLPSSLALL